MSKVFNKKTIDEILEDLELSSLTKDEKEANEPLTFWIPAEYKAKYDDIQNRTQKKFGKLLKEVLKRSIDKVEAEPEAS